MRSHAPAAVAAFSLLALGTVPALAGAGSAAATVAPSTATSVQRSATAAVPAAAAMVPQAAALPDVTVATAGQSGAPCRTVGFTPRAVAVGLTPIPVAFNVTASRCTLRYWELSLGPTDIYTYATRPKVLVAPTRAMTAGPKDVVVTTCDGEFVCQDSLLTKAFAFKRRTTWQTRSVDASPEPAHSGRTLTLRGRLLVVNWKAGRYVGYGGRSVAVEFRTLTGSYTHVKTLVTDSNGWARTTVTATRSGAWRLRYGGNPGAGPATAVGDTVQALP